MAIYTPRGHRINLEERYSLRLMARLAPRVKAARVLRTTDALEALPKALAFMAALGCFAARLGPVAIFGVVFVAGLAGFLLTLRGWVNPPGLIAIGSAAAAGSEWGLLMAAIVLAGFFWVGWPGVAASLLGAFASYLARQWLDAIAARRMQRRTGKTIFSVERNFLNAYRLHAGRSGASGELELTASEREDGRWEEARAELAESMPEMVALWDGPERELSKTTGAIVADDQRP